MSQEAEVAVQDDTPVLLEFRGTGKEYFRIWIVNVFLTIITLGIYSAWAKVRTTRYFYGNTLLDNVAFEYHAKPLQILKGRILALILFAAYIFTSTALPVVNLVIIVVIALLAPLVMRQAMRFKTAVSSYRGIRFSFKGGVGRAYGVYLLAPLLGFMTLYLAWPWVHKKSSDYHMNNLHYGTAGFKSSLRTPVFFKSYIMASLFSMLVMTAGTMLLVLGGYLSNITFSEDMLSTPGFTTTILGALAAFSLLMSSLFFRAFIKARVTNHVYGVTSIDSRVFLHSQLGVLKLFWIYLTNLLGILFTLGLFIPWAKVRLMRYKIQSTRVSATGSLDGFVGEQLEQRSAFGEELGDAFDLDIAGGL